MKATQTESLAVDVRLLVLEMINRGESAHIASAFSIVDILSVLYLKVMHYNIKDPDSPDRDRFILSKGHGGAAVYAVLAKVGMLKEADVLEHCQNGSLFSGHVSHKGIAGVEFSTGSLGHGLPVIAGMALAASMDSNPVRHFVILGDGECDEGTIWESALFCAHNNLNNIVAIIDHNKYQSLTTVEDTLSLEPLSEKWLSFGWDVTEIDGHDHMQIHEALSTHSDKPRCIIAHTIKGKGVSFMENEILWHYRPPIGDDYDTARRELLKLKSSQGEG